MPIRYRTHQSFLEYWVFSATERLFPSKGALESDSRTGPGWIAPEKRDSRKVAYHQSFRSLRQPRRTLAAYAVQFLTPRDIGRAYTALRVYTHKLHCRRYSGKYRKSHFE